MAYRHSWLNRTSTAVRHISREIVDQTWSEIIRFLAVGLQPLVFTRDQRVSPTC